MDIDERVRQVRKRIKKGETLEEILQELKKELNEQELHKLVEIIIKQDFARHKAKRQKSYSIWHKPITWILLVVFIFAIVGAYILFTNIQRDILEKRWQLVNGSEISDPVQITPTTGSTMQKQYGKNIYTIIPVADFKITALVASKKNYNDIAECSKTDLGLLWGKIAKQDYSNFLRITQDNRKLIYYPKRDNPYSKSFIDSHTTNIHTIASNNRIQEGINNIRPPQAVYLEGYLVNVYGNNFEWKTSLSRTDTGNGACEIMYIKKLKIGDNIYE